MTWREDRDALIAQTMAFVQSVTGKPVDFAQFALPSPTSAPETADAAVAAPFAAPPAVSSEQPAARDAINAVTPLAEAALAEQQRRAKSLDAGTAPQLAIEAKADTSKPESFGTEPFTSIADQFTLQRDMQTEIRTRVASFRAHQERFNRERQEYFSTTLARLHASKSKTPPPDRSPSDK
jgi:hypothetical protein